MSGIAKGRILIDGYNLSLHQGTGIATYSRSLSRQVHDLGFDVDILYGTDVSQDPLLQEMSFYSIGTQPALPPGSITSRLIRLAKTSHKPVRPVALAMGDHVVKQGIAERYPYFDRAVSSPALWEMAAFKYTVRKRLTTVVPDRPVSIFHATYPLPIQVEGAVNICTIHDLIPFRLPYTTLGNKSRQLNLFRLIARTYDHIVTVSETSKRDIVELLGVPEHKVTNTYQAVTTDPATVSLSDDDVRAQTEGIFGLPHKNYFLFYGALEPKKNLGRLIQAYCASGSDMPLVIVGKLGWLYDDDLRLIDAVNGASRDRRRILRMDYLPQSMLDVLVRGARALLFPSLYEGFGLPVLEAMAAGTPVMTSNASALPEVAGDAALLIDPYDIRTMAEAVRSLAEDHELCRRLSTQGMERAELYSPEAYRGRLDSLYTALLAKNNEPGTSRRLSRR